MKSSSGQLSQIYRIAFKNMVKQTDSWVQYTVNKVQQDFELIANKDRMTADAVLSQLKQNGQHLAFYKQKNQQKNWRKINSYANFFPPSPSARRQRSIQNIKIKNKPNLITTLISSKFFLNKLRKCSFSSQLNFTQQQQTKCLLNQSTTSQKCQKCHSD